MIYYCISTMTLTVLINTLTMSLIKCFNGSKVCITVLIAILTCTSQIMAKTTTVHFRIFDNSIEKIIPVMICITDAEGNIHLPPDGRVPDAVSTTKDYYTGIDFKRSKNWIGPIRKMNGKGNNNDRSYVYELLASIPYWQDPVMYLASGDFSIELPPGKYQIAIDHGLEYIPVIEDFVIQGDEKHIKKTIELERWINLPEMGWYSGDVHVHHPTETKKQRKFLLQSAKAVDLHVVNVLEMGHHLGTDFKQAGFGKKFRKCDGDYCLISGQEDPRGTYGHIVGLNIQSIVRDTNTYDLYDITFKGIHKQPGALVGYAHFSWAGLGIKEGLPIYATTLELDFIELLQFSKMNTLGYYDYLNMGFKLTAAAGSDVPWGSNMGEVRTMVYTRKELNVDEWFAGIANGNTYVSNGPALFLTVDDALPGTELNRVRDDMVSIKVEAKGHESIGLPVRLQLVSNKGVLKEVKVPEGQEEISVSLDMKFKESAWIAAYVECDNGAMAHCTPVYVVVDGKPTWSMESAPGLIQSQLDIIANVEGETGKKSSMHERLESARQFYENLLDEIQ